MRLKEKRSFTEGKIFPALFFFALPIMATSIMQILYNMISQIVVGQFSGDTNALGAIGSTSSFSALMTNVLIGLSSGSGVAVAQYFGAKRDDDTSRSVGAAMFFGLVAGFSMAAGGALFAEPVLRLLGTKPEFMSVAVPYIRVIMIGIPALAIYNFGSSILRSVGDSYTPVIAISISGALTVLLNLAFVAWFGLGVIGSGAAIVIAEWVSAVYIVLVMLGKRGEPYKLEWSKIRPDKKYIGKICRYGIPAGIQSSCFSLSGLITTSAINTFPKTTVTAGAIAQNLDNITETCLASYISVAMTFSAQNFGAKKTSRINKTLIYSLIQVSVIAVILTQGILLFAPEILGMFVETSDPDRAEIISIAVRWLWIILPFYFTSGIMYVVSGCLRGMGYSVGPMIMNLIGVCGLRIIWIFFIFPLPALNTLEGLLSVYPISWSVTAVLQSLIAVYAWIKMYKKKAPESVAGESAAEETV